MHAWRGFVLAYKYDEQVWSYREGATKSHQRINMAELPLKLEPLFALKSNKNQYMHCVLLPNTKGVLKFCEPRCNKNFSTEIAKTLGYVHIKCATNEKYLRRETNQDDCLPSKIVAAADSKNEDITDEGCTLFELKSVEVHPTERAVKCRVIHVQSRLYIRPHDDEILRAVSPIPDPSGADLLIVDGGCK